MSTVPQLTVTGRPSYEEVVEEHLINLPAELFEMAGRRTAAKMRRLPSTPPGWTAVVILPDNCTYVGFAASDAIAPLVREAGRVVVRGLHPAAVQMLGHELRRATWGLA